ncbi:hypothetical protein Aperf_G00000074527 [Anoplocephala perfoliata]
MGDESVPGQVDTRHEFEVRSLNGKTIRMGVIISEERAAKEMELQRRQALRSEAEEAIRAKRKRELQRLAALQREETDLLKRDAVEKRVVEEEKERLLKKDAEKMAELDECIRLAKNNLESQKSRPPLAPINTEEASPRQTLLSSSSLRGGEKEFEQTENSAIIEGRISLPFEEEKHGIGPQRNSPIADSASSVTELGSNQDQESCEKREQGREKLSDPILEIQSRSKGAQSGKSTPLQSKRHLNREEFEGSRAKGIIYGKGIGPTARESAWKKPKPREHLPEDIIAFSQELIESPQEKASPWFDPAKNSRAFGSSNALCAYLRSLETNSRQGQIGSSKQPSIPFFAALDRVIAMPLLARAEIVDKCLLDHFVMDLRLLEHLRLVKSIFCHEHHTISPQISDALFTEVSNRGEVRSIFNDKRRFEDAVPPELFKPRVQDWKGQLDRSAASYFERKFEQVPFYFKQLKTVSVIGCRGHVDRIFRTLVLIYNPPWPVNICLHERVLAKYNTVFCVIGRIKYALWELESVFHFLRQRVGKVGRHHFQLSIWRHRMETVVRAIDSYISLHAVQSQWRVFSKHVGGSLADDENGNPLNPPKEPTKARSIDEVCERHEACVDGILQSCLIDDTDEEGQRIRNSLIEMLECVHRFRKALLWCQGGRDPMDGITSIHNQFRKYAQNLHRILRMRIYEASVLSYLLQTLEYFCAPTG